MRALSPLSLNPQPPLPLPKAYISHDGFGTCIPPIDTPPVPTRASSRDYQRLVPALPPLPASLPVRACRHSAKSSLFSLSLVTRGHLPSTANNPRQNRTQNANKLNPSLSSAHKNIIIIRRPSSIKIDHVQRGMVRSLPYPRLIIGPRN